MRRNDERRVMEVQSRRHAVARRASAALALLLTSTGMIPWAGSVPGAFAAARPDTESLIAATQDAASGGSNVIADPLYGWAPVVLRQQDAEDSIAGATGASGTVNGVPRETTEAAPATTGPGVPLGPGNVMLPPSV
ncbi:MAG TPA: hypothetical protein VHG52_06510, partial [Thermomicrobiales bacterium]|nr:hypothetical protein [Thermomicrobiales bacterium]